MAALGFTGIGAAMAKLKKHELLVLGRIASTKRALVSAVFTDLVKNSPQWSGNLASQWYVEFHGIRGKYKPISYYVKPNQWVASDDPYQMGNDPAVASTLLRELPKIEAIRWNSTVRIVNYAPYAAEVDQGIGPPDDDGGNREIRDVNKIGGAVAMVGFVTTKYKNLRYLRGLAK